MIHCFFHRIAFHFLSCLVVVLFCCTVYYCLLSFLIFSLLATSSVQLNLIEDTRSASWVGKDTD